MISKGSFQPGGYMMGAVQGNEATFIEVELGLFIKEIC
jgi:hypothetical protein